MIKPLFEFAGRISFATEADNVMWLQLWHNIRHSEQHIEKTTQTLRDQHGWPDSISISSGDKLALRQPRVVPPSIVPSALLKQTTL